MRLPGPSAGLSCSTAGRSHLLQAFSCPGCVVGILCHMAPAMICERARTRQAAWRYAVDQRRLEELRRCLPLHGLLQLAQKMHPQVMEALARSKRNNTKPYKAVLQGEGARFLDSSGMQAPAPRRQLLGPLLSGSAARGASAWIQVQSCGSSWSSRSRSGCDLPHLRNLPQFSGGGANPGVGSWGHQRCKKS